MKVLKFIGNGRVSVSVAELLRSPKVQAQIAAINKIAAALRNKRRAINLAS